MGGRPTPEWGARVLGFVFLGQFLCFIFPSNEWFVRKHVGSDYLLLALPIYRFLTGPMQVFDTTFDRGVVGFNHRASEEGAWW